MSDTTTTTYTIKVSAREHCIIMAALRFAEWTPEALTEHLGYNDESPASADEIGDLAEQVSCCD